MRARRVGLIVAVVLGVALTLFLGYWIGTRRPQPSEHAATEAHEAHEEHEGGSKRTVTLSAEALAGSRLEVVKVHRGRLRRDLAFTGEVAPNPDRIAIIGSRVSARISKVNVALGDRVTRGQMLALVESPEYGRARGAYLTAVARREQAEAAFNRQQQLRQENISSAADFEAARANLASARADAEAARSGLAALGVSASEQVASASIALRSPIDGVVVVREAVLGQSVDANAALFTIADLSEVWVVLNVFERDLGRVAIGNEVVVTTAAHPGREFRGRVSHVSELLDERTRTARVRVAIANEDRALRPGMFCRGRVLAAEQATEESEDDRPTLAVPITSIQRIGTEDVVFVRTSERTFEARPVRVGARTGLDAEVRSGLRDGEDVVADGSFTLKGELERSSFADEDD